MTSRHVQDAGPRPGRPSSIRTRIVWTTAVVTALAMATMILAVLVVLTRVTQGRIDASLEDRLAATDAAITRRPDGRLRVRDAGADEVIDSVWVFGDDGVQVSGPQAGRRIQATVTSLGRVTRATRIERRDRVYLAEPVRLRGERRASGVAVAAESTKPYEVTQRVLIGGLAVLGVLVAGATAVLTAWTVRRTLRPVQRMTTMAAEWNDRALDSRFHLGAGTDEFSQLGNTLDALLDRVAQALRGEQQLTAELAHELRTPLTTIRAEAELGTIGEEDPATHRRWLRIMGQVDRLDGTIATLLALARHQSGPSRTTDLATLLDSLVASTSTPVPVLVDFLPQSSTEGVLLLGNAELVERVVAPVLDNAVRYAAAEVRITVRREGGEALIQVCDDGRGITSEDDDVFQAGVSAGDGDGAGLGLPLSRRVAAGLGGTVEVRSPQDPTIVEIRLPTA